MDNQRFITKLVNPLGETRWQPTLPNGVKAWMHMARLPPWAIEWRTEDGTNSIEIRGPIAYRSRTHAILVAKRQWGKVVRNQWESETGSIDPRGVLKPKECCSPECEATSMAEMPLGIPTLATMSAGMRPEYSVNLSDGSPIGLGWGTYEIAQEYMNAWRKDGYDAHIVRRYVTGPEKV